MSKIILRNPSDLTLKEDGRGEFPDSYYLTDKGIQTIMKSKHVQIEKLKFTIEMLYKFRECTFGKGKNVIAELEQQLKELQDGK
jgi:hypothetical protein